MFAECWLLSAAVVSRLWRPLSRVTCSKHLRNPSVIPIPLFWLIESAFQTPLWRACPLIHSSFDQSQKGLDWPRASATMGALRVRRQTCPFLSASNNYYFGLKNVTVERQLVDRVGERSVFALGSWRRVILILWVPDYVPKPFSLKRIYHWANFKDIMGWLSINKVNQFYITQKGWLINWFGSTLFTL